MNVLYAVIHQFYHFLTHLFLKVPDFCCLEVVLILQSFQIRRAIMLNVEYPQRLERSVFPCCFCSDVSCKLEHTKVRMRKSLVQDLHHFRDGITVTASQMSACSRFFFLGSFPFMVIRESQARPRLLHQ